MLVFALTKYLLLGQIVTSLPNPELNYLIQEIVLLMEKEGCFAGWTEEQQSVFYNKLQYLFIQHIESDYE